MAIHFRQDDEVAALPQGAQVLLARRAERLRAAAHTEAEDAPFWVARFALGKVEFAIELGLLRGIVPIRAVSPLALAPPDVVGAVRFQGEIVAVLSLAALLAEPAWGRDTAFVLVVERGAGRLCGIDCEQTPRPASLPSSLVQTARAAARGPSAEFALPDRTLLRLPDLRQLLDQRRGGRPT